MNKELKQVRILMLGESGVGKTSLILSLVSEQFLDDTQDPNFELPAKLEPITIPAEVTLEKIPGLIIDFSFREQSEQDLVNEIENASVICLVYSIENEQSKEKLSSFWLPKIEQIECKHSDSTSSVEYQSKNQYKRPIVLVGNRTDTNLDRNSPVQDSVITQLVRSHSQIETCIMCSAKTLKNVPEVFYYAQKSVLYPTAPVYDVDRKQLSPLGEKCFTRIFKLCDMDNDGRLNDLELNEFQIKCFGVRLNSSSLQEVKSILRSNSDNLIEDEITLRGFLHLQILFFKKGRHETSWTILKKFGYKKNLSLSHEFTAVNLKIAESCSVELSQKCFEFLRFLFNKYDQDKDESLNQKELSELFSACPVISWGKDVHNTVETDTNGYITYCGYLSQWVLTTYFDIKTSAENLAYLGYNNYFDENLTSAYIVSRPKEIDISKKQTLRNVFLCYVYGRKKCGKTSFLQGLLGRDLVQQALIDPEDITRWACNLVQFQNIEKYLILKEINSSDLEMHEAYPPDVVVLLYDLTDPNSFKFIADIFLNLYKDRPIPCVLVGTKSDQIEIKQNFPLSVEKFAEYYKLPPPQYFSASPDLLASCDIFPKLVAIASYPKMYPMRSQIWSFFQRIGAAAQEATRKKKRTRSDQKSLFTSTNFLTPLFFFTRNQNRKNRLKSFLESDSMIIRYTFLTATCITMAFFLIKFVKKK